MSPTGRRNDYIRKVNHSEWRRNPRLHTSTGSVTSDMSDETLDIKHQSFSGQPLITAAEQTFVRPLWTSTDRLRLNWQGPLNCIYDAWSIVSTPLRRRLGVMIVYWSDCDGWPLGVYKWSSQSAGGIVQNWPFTDTDMISLALFYLVAVACSARRTHALPLYPDTNLEPQAGETLNRFLPLE